MIHFIVNAHARSGEAHNIWNNLEQILISKAIEYTVYYTEYPGHAIELANNISSLACEENPITLVIFGGDGSVNEVYNGITSNHKYITLGYIPTGSGNDYARGLSLPRNSEEALNLILSSTSTKLVEHGIVHNDGNTRKFAVSCGIGYDADVTYRVANSSLKKKFNKLKIGKLVYTFLGILQIIQSPKLKAHIQIDDKVVDTDCFYFASMHVLKYEGGGWPFALHADPSDGKIAFCLFYNTGRLRFTLNLLSSLFGKHGNPNRKGVMLCNCDNVSIELNECTHSHTDGELLGIIKTLTVTSCNKENFFNVIN